MKTIKKNLRRREHPTTNFSFMWNVYFHTCTSRRVSAGFFVESKKIVSVAKVRSI